MMSARLYAGRLALIAICLVGSLAPGSVAANANDMISGGCQTASDCAQKINADAKTRRLFAAHGITVSALRSEDVKKGTVTKSGKVIVNGRVVATNAHSYGRQFIAGSTKERGFYRRSTQTSFQTGSLEALVIMPDGKFKAAILTSCGNLITAAPVVTKPPKKTTKAPKPKPKRAPTTIVINQTQSQSQSQAQAEAQSKEDTSSSTTNATTPGSGQATAAAAATAPASVSHASAAAPAPAPTVQEEAQTLPEAGAGAISLLGASTLGTVGWYYRRSRRAVKKALENTQVD